MGAWKSSDGGSITPVGQTLATVTATGNTIVVSGAANVAGIIVRTVSVFGMASGSQVEFRVSATPVLVAKGIMADSLRDLFIPAGRAFSVFITTSGQCDITYDVL